MPKPTIAVQLHEAQAEVATLTAEVEKLKKDLSSEKSSTAYHVNAKGELQAQIDSLHAALDGISMAPGRVGKEDRYGSKPELSVTSRFAGLLGALAFRGSL